MIKPEEIRKSLRISHAGMDDEIKRNMEACKLDMKRVGVNTEVDDATLDKACEIYCKAQFDYQGKGDVYLNHYEALRDAMSLSEAYRCTTQSSDSYQKKTGQTNTGTG